MHHVTIREVDTSTIRDLEDCFKGMNRSIAFVYNNRAYLYLGNYTALSMDLGLQLSFKPDDEITRCYLHYTWPK